MSDTDGLFFFFKYKHLKLISAQTYLIQSVTLVLLTLLDIYCTTRTYAPMLFYLESTAVSLPLILSSPLPSLTQPPPSSLRSTLLCLASSLTESSSVLVALFQNSE